tara:strand:+ start:338 stop:586 length:249 start_codon:yes stop_codon:yes gene_type:complete
MRTIIKCITAISLSFITQSCSNKDDCTPATFDITSLEMKYGCTNTTYQMDIDLSEDFIFIKSQTGCEAYDVLIEKKGLTNVF